MIPKITRSAFETSIKGYGILVADGKPEFLNIEDLKMFTKKKPSEEDVKQFASSKSMEVVAGYETTEFLFSMDLDRFCKAAEKEKKEEQLKEEE